MNKFWDWLVKSSADSQQVALTAKGLISTLLPILLVFFHNPNVNDLPDSIYTLIVAFFSVVSACMVTAGMIRKLFVTFTA